MATRNRGDGRADCPVRLLRLYHYQLANGEILSTAEAELGRPDPTDERQNGIDVGVFNDGFWPRCHRPSLFSMPPTRIRMPLFIFWDDGGNYLLAKKKAPAVC